MGDIKGEMNMYADDISVSETEVKGKLKKIKNSEEYRKFEQNEQRQAEKNGMEELEDVKTAVSEAVTNAVIHGYSDEIGIIYIEARIEGEELIISVRDEGKGILDVEKAMEPMYTTDTTGERSGMGFSFMEAFMDEVEVESKVGCGTCVTMKKRIGRGYMNKEQEEKETAESYG